MFTTFQNLFYYFKFIISENKKKIILIWNKTKKIFFQFWKKKPILQKMNLDTNYTVDLDIFSNESPIECYKLRIVSINCIVLFLLSVIFNSFLLIIFLTKKQLQKSSNIFIFTLTLFNLIGSITEFPFVIVSNLYCK